MTSFDLRLEPAAAPRLAAVALLLHLGAAAFPWFVGVAPALAAVLSIVALAGVVSTLLGLPGRHHALAVLVFDRAGCRVRLAVRGEFIPATIGTGSRAFGGLAFVRIQAGSRRFAWLLPRGSLPPACFRRLKARIRCTC
jgi:hypothetical protein